MGKKDAQRFRQGNVELGRSAGASWCARGQRGGLWVVARVPRAFLGCVLLWGLCNGRQML